MKKNLKKVLITTFVVTQLLITTVSAKEMQRYIFEFNSIKQTDIAYQGKERMYYFLDKEVNKELDSIVAEFKPQGKTDFEQLKSVCNFFKQLGLKVSEDSTYNSYHQIENIKNGHTKCLGVTVLGGKLLEKTDIEYRYVLRQRKYRNDILGNPVDAGHIFIEVKTDKGKWMQLDFANMLYSYYAEFAEEYLKDDIKIANKRETNEIMNRKFYNEEKPEQEGIYREFVVSPTYKQGKQIDNKLQLINNL